MIPLRRYYIFLKNKYRENTALTYYRTINKFTEEYPELKTKEDYLEAINEYINTRKTDNSFNTFISAMRNYLDFKGWHDFNLPDRIPRKSEKKKINAPSKKKIKRFFDSFDLSKESDLRLYFICIIATLTGITTKRLVQLQIDDELILNLINTSEEIKKIYHSYLKIRFSSGYKSNFLFPNKNRNSKTEYMNIQGIYKLIKSYTQDKFKDELNIKYQDLRNFYIKHHRNLRYSELGF